MRLKASAGWNQTEEDWLRLLRLAPGGCFGIDVEGTLAASATVIRYGSDLAWIGMVLTLPEYRGRGLARRLMEHSLEHAGPGPVRLDASDMGRPLYLALGFVEECPVERWVCPATAVPRHEATLLEAGADIALDRAAFSYDRTALLAELVPLGSALLPGEGYALSRAGAHGAYFGPCISTTPDNARRLLDSCLARTSGEVYWDLFPHHTPAVDLAASLGFQPVRRLSRMVCRGPVALPDPRIYAIAGFEFG